MINVPFLLKIMMQLIDVLLQSGMLGDNDRKALSDIVGDVKNRRCKQAKGEK